MPVAAAAVNPRQPTSYIVSCHTVHSTAHWRVASCTIGTARISHTRREQGRGTGTREQFRNEPCPSPLALAPVRSVRSVAMRLSVPDGLWLPSASDGMLVSHACVACTMVAMTHRPNMRTRAGSCTRTCTCTCNMHMHMRVTCNMHMHMRMRMCMCMYMRML